MNEIIEIKTGNIFEVLEVSSAASKSKSDEKTKQFQYVFPISQHRQFKVIGLKFVCAKIFFFSLVSHKTSLKRKKKPTNVLTFLFL